MKRFLRVLSLVAVLAMVITSTAAAQGTLDPGAGAVNFTVMNLHTTTAASVRAQYINTSGAVDSEKLQTVDPLSSAGFPIDASGLPDNWEGSVIVSASQPIVAFAQIRWQGGTFGDGKTAGAYNGFVQGANKLYFPSLAARAGKQFSKIAIQSAEAASTTDQISATVKFYNRDGSLAKQKTVSILKGTQTTIDLLAENLPTTTPPGDGWLGSATVESTSLIAGVATNHWKTYSTAYSGMSSGGTKAFIPEARRRLKNGAWDQYTSILVQNLDSATAANVTVKWFDRTGTLLHSFTDSIPANSSHGYNTRFTTSDVPDHAALHNALGDTWNGSVVVESNVDVVAVANLQWTDTSSVGAAGTSYVSESGGFSQVFVPATFRREASGTWKQFTGLIVQNVGASACNSFTVEWRDRNGTKLLDFTDSLASNISHGYNTRFGADMPSGADPTSLGSDFRGSVFVNAPGCELIAIHNTLWPLWTDSTTYNAFGQ